MSLSGKGFARRKQPGKTLVSAVVALDMPVIYGQVSLVPVGVLIRHIHLIVKKARFDALHIHSRTLLLPTDVPIWNILTCSGRCLWSRAARGFDGREAATART